MVCDHVRVVLMATLAQLDPARPALIATVVTTRALAAEPLLFVGLGSKVGVALETMLVNVPIKGAATVRVKLVVAPTGKLGMLQLTTPAALLPPAEALTNVLV